MTDIIEKAARALFRYEPGPYGDCVDWAIEQDFGWRAYVDEVKLVLQAIREPSEAMRLSGRDKCPRPISCWQAMVDAALGEAVMDREATMREAALSAMTRFADREGVTDRNWTEVRDGNTVTFTGTANHGRQFRIGYEL